MSGDIRIVIQDDAEGASEDRSIDEIHRFADEKLTEAARFKNEAAHLRALSARDRVGAAQMTAQSEAWAAQSEYRAAVELGGATDRQLMAMFDWTSASQANVYTAAASKKILAAEGSRLLSGKFGGNKKSGPP
jgi:hypothetical protein